jgi:hypothetical protein
MRKAIAAALLALLPAGAVAQQLSALPVETVESIELDTLTGIWKISFPETILKASLLLVRGQYRWSDAHQTFCRLTHDGGDKAVVICLAGGAWREGTATLEGKDIHVAWGTAMTRFVIDARLQSTNAFRGIFSLKLTGFRNDAALPAAGQRFSVPANAPDPAGKTELVADTLAQLANGGITRPHDDAIASRFLGAVANTPAEIQALGKIGAIVYLGEGGRQLGRNAHRNPLPPFVFSTYQVEFENGQRLCGIHQREDGVLDGFLCV